MIHWSRSGWFFAAVLAGACGDGGGGGGGSGGASYGDIADAIGAPTGTVDKSSAPAIADAYQQISQNGAGSIGKQDGAKQEMSCPAGGKFSITAQSSGGSAKSDISYDNCCYQASCCLDGGGTWYFSTSQGSAQSYNYCGSYSLTSTCSGSSASVKYEGCFGLDGWVYSVKVDGETFAVSGNYSNGNGTLKVAGENGSFTCTYTNNTGSCTGTSGTFSF
jgi:hypothetical protein